MIIDTGNRTDIPAFYSEWFMNRIREGYVMVRNPYSPEQVSRYRLDPEVVDALMFCSKNPEPMVKYLDELSKFKMIWFVTITPYGKGIEPGVPDKRKVIESFKKISDKVGLQAMSWRYDPIFISETYSVDYHIDAFERMAAELEGYTERVVISFIDLFEKTKKNFPEAREVIREERFALAKAFAEIGKKHNMTIRSCLEGVELAQFGIDVSGCMSQQVIEEAIGAKMIIPASRHILDCNCFMGNDIGAYNSCAHFCKYCYANYDREAVIANMKKHDPKSPFLIGNSMPLDRVNEPEQKSYITNQLEMEIKG